MNSLYPIFPLNLVAFPGEKLNLHIFEPRYKQLVKDVLTQDQLFGIPAYIHNKLEYGTLVKIMSVEKIYEDGRMDIKTSGVRVFKVVDFANPWQDKLYSAGELEWIGDVNNGSDYTRSEIRKLVADLYRIIKNTPEEIFQTDFHTFEVAHKIGLTIEQEYEFFIIEEEAKRQQYILQHLKKALAVMRGIHDTQNRIKQNGHFKHFDPLTF